MTNAHRFILSVVLAVLVALAVVIVGDSLGTSYTDRNGERVTVGNAAQAHPDARCDFKTRMHYRYTWRNGLVRHFTRPIDDFVYNGRYYITYYYGVRDVYPERWLGGYRFYKQCAVQSAYA